MEARLRVAADDGERVPFGLEIARLWDEEGDRAAALAAYERVLRWNRSSRPRSGRSSSAGPAAAGASIGTIDVALPERLRRRGAHRPAPALARAPRPERRPGPLLRAPPHPLAVGPRPAGAGRGRRAAVEANAWTELAAVYLDLAAAAPDEATRGRHQRALATIYEERLKDRCGLPRGPGNRPAADRRSQGLRGARPSRRGPGGTRTCWPSSTSSLAPALPSRRARRRSAAHGDLRAAARRPGTRLPRVRPAARSRSRDSEAVANARRLAEAKGLCATSTRSMRSSGPRRVERGARGHRPRPPRGPRRAARRTRPAPSTSS